MSGVSGWTQTQDGANITGTTSAAAYLPGASSLGTLLVLLLTARGTSTAFTGPGGKWVMEAGAGFGNSRAEVWSYKGNPGSLYNGSGNTATWTNANAAAVKAQMQEYTPPSPGGQRTDAAGTGGESGTPQTSLPVTVGVSASGDLLVGAWASVFTTAPGLTFTAPSGWPNADGQNASAQLAWWLGHDLAGGAGPLTPALGLSSDTNMASWAAAVVAFTTLGDTDAVSGAEGSPADVGVDDAAGFP